MNEVVKKFLIPEDSANVKWYQRPFATAYGLYLLLVRKYPVD